MKVTVLFRYLCCSNNGDVRKETSKFSKGALRIEIKYFFLSLLIKSACQKLRVKSNYAFYMKWNTTHRLETGIFSTCPDRLYTCYFGCEQSNIRLLETHTRVAGVGGGERCQFLQ
jgi:hypothetical protein